jgi:hypothetical protein
MDDGSEDSDDFGSILPDFDQKRFNLNFPAKEVQEPALSIELISSSAIDDAPMFPEYPPPRADDVQEAPTSPMFAGPIKIHTSLGPDVPAEEMRATQLGAGLGGLWGIPPPPGEAERFRDLSHTKRRWTVNERA